MQINVAVTDSNNIVCEVVPPQTQIITIDRGVAGNGIVSIVPVTISTFQYLRITYTNGTVQDVGPLTSTAYTATAPITIVGNTISLATVPIASGGTDATNAADAIKNLLPSYTGNANKRLGLNSGGTALEWVLDGGGTVTSVSGTGTVNGLTLTGTVTTSGSLTLGGTLSGIANSALTNSAITINGTSTSLGGSINVGTVTSVAASGGTTGLTFTGSPITTSGTLTLGGTLAVANGGTGVTTSSGANSVVLRDANGNITTNGIFEGYITQAASGTAIVLVASSVQNYQITGSGGQTIRLPDATTLPNGATFTFNNNQSSGAITVQNNSSTTVSTIQSGGYVTIVLLSNSIAAGSWDRHDSTPSNVSWSTNTLDYAGSITSATWNGNAVAINRGGTGQTTANAAFNALAPSQTGNSGKYLTTDGSNTSWATNPLGTVTSVAATVPSFLSISGSPITTSGTLAFGLSGTALPTTSGGTGLTSFTANGVVYASSTSALTTGSALTFNGNELIVNGSSSVNLGATTSAFKVAGSASGSANTILQSSASTGVAYWISAKTSGILSIGGNGGTEPSAGAINIGSNGNVGIGTDNPAYKLQVIGAIQIQSNASGTQQVLQLNNSDTSGTTQVVKLGFASGGVAKSSINAAVYNNDYMTFNVGSDTERVRIDASGNFLIATTASAGKLTVYNGTVGASTTTLTPNATLWMDYAGGTGNNAGSGSSLVFSNSNIPNNLNKSAAIGAPSEDTGGLSRSIGLSFWTSAFDANRAERMRITSDGNVGIGTSSPSAKLHVENGNVLARNSTLAISFTAQSNQNTAYTAALTCNWDENILLLSAAGNKVLEVGGYTSANVLRLFTGNSERARIDSSGNFGIGTSNPATRLHVESASATTNTKVVSPLSGSLFYSGFEVARTTVSGGALMRSARNASSGGVGWEWLTTADNAAEVSGTYTSRMTLDSTGNLYFNLSPVGGSAKLVVRPNSTYGMWVSTGFADGTPYGLEFGLQPNHGSYRSAIRGVPESYGGTDSGALAFYTSSGYNTGAISEQARITSTGNFGLGTNSPNGKLTILGNTFDIRNTSGSYGTGYAVEISTNANQPRVDWIDNSVYTGTIKSVSGVFVIQNNSNNVLTLGTNATERARITNNNFMVGTTSTSGNIGNDIGEITGRTKTASGSFIPPSNGTWNDITTIAYPGLYILHAYIYGYNAGTADWSNAWMITYTGGNNPFVAPMLGATGNVQCRTKTGATTTLQIFAAAGAGIEYTWAILRIA